MCLRRAKGEAGGEGMTCRVYLCLNRETKRCQVGGLRAFKEVSVSAGQLVSTRAKVGHQRMPMVGRGALSLFGQDHHSRSESAVSGSHRLCGPLPRDLSKGSLKHAP